MKLIKIIIALIFVTSLCKAQTILDPPSILDSLDQTMLNFDVSDFKLGWNWGSPGVRLDNALSIKYSHGAFDTLRRPLGTPNMNYIDAIPGFTTGHMHYGKLNSMAVQFDPAIRVRTTSNYIAESWENKGAIFGFQTKNKGTIDSATGSTFHCYILRKDSVISETKVLYDSWPQKKSFYLLDYSNNPDNSYLVNNLDSSFIRVNEMDSLVAFHPLNGTRWYLSANVKVIDSIQSLEPVQTIMKIKLKYKLNDSTCGYIKFYKVPRQGISSLVELESSMINTTNRFRGLTRQDSVLEVPIDYFPITNRMLRTNAQGTNNTDITLSAYFIAREKYSNDDSLFNYLNPYFEPEELWYKVHNTSQIPYFKYIARLEVEVYYCGIKNVAIDWIKVQTEQAKDLLSGKYDQGFVDSCQQLLENTHYAPLNNKMHRFYVFDEFLKPHISTMRYVNKLLNGNAQSEFFFSDVPQLNIVDHALGFKEYWTGSSIGWNMGTASPFYNYGMAYWDSTVKLNREVLGTTYGSSGIKNLDTTNRINQVFTEVRFDSLNSGYEIFLMGGDSAYRRWDNGYNLNYPTQKLLPSQSNWNDDSLNTLYNTTYDQDKHRYLMSIGSLFNLEKQLFNMYYRKDALFMNKPIWYNIWLTSESWTYYKDPLDSNKSIISNYNGSGRPETDSELKLSTGLPLILGIKGFFHWHKTTYPYDNVAPQTDLLDFPRILSLQTNKALLGTDGIESSKVGLDYILDNRLGGDYLVPFTDPNFSYHYKPNGQYDFTNLGIDQNHVFAGTRSLRYELYKLHKYIRTNEEELLNLSLVSWLGVGHRKWYTQDLTYGNPELGDTLLNSICISKNIKTRKLWQPLEQAQGYVPTSYEPATDRFFDITILKKKDVELDSEYVMGVANRRSDELIDTYNNTNGTWQLDYVPSALFDSLCIGPNAPYWKSMYWLKLGAREISIPLINPTQRPNSEVAFRITEIGYDNDSLLKEYWFQPPYNHLIDTNILVGGDLKIRLQPGQAKLLKVQIVSPSVLTTGNLEYSNQTKIVAFPCESNFNANGMDTMGKVRYHAVYTRKAGPSYNYSNVYYKRSFPMNRLEKDIKWEDLEYQLNDSLVVYNCSHTVQYTALDLASNFPSLVVRCDTIDNVLTPMVYVVYQGGGELCINSPVIRIIENVFPANDSIINPPKGRQIANATSNYVNFHQGSGSSVWGVPVINASAHGNYYAWNDSLLGIVAGFKPPEQLTEFTSNQKTSFRGMIPTTQLYLPGSYHPSLNTYSTISDNEMDCALVWEENPYSVYRYSNNRIFYTRLKYCDSTGLVHYLSPNWGHINPWYQRAIIVDNGRIARLDDLNDSITYKHLPMIHRDVDYYDAVTFPEFCGMHSRILKNDRVYWQGRSPYLNLQCIFMKFITINDNLASDGCIPYSPSTWLVEGTPGIMATTTDLAHPNVAQGKLVKQYHTSGNNKIVFYTFDQIVNDSVAVINFVEYPHDIDLTSEVPRTADIWQINHSYFSLFSGPGSYTYCWDFAGNAPNAHRIGSKGKYSHLARLPYINNDKTWEYGHRIFESSSDQQGQNPLIKSYDYLLFKKSYDKDKNYQFFGFIDTCGNRTLLSPIFLTIDGREHAIIPKIDKEHKIYNDTLYSDWLEIGGYQDIDMLHFGSNKKCLDLKLQRKDDNKIFSIQTDKLSSRLDYTKHSIHLLNGKSKQYRFVWIKTRKSTLNELTILGLPPMNEMTKDELLGKISINVDENYLDLSEDITSEIPDGSSLFIYPNPANEKIVIFYEQERKSNINLGIYDMLGTTIKNVFSGYIEKGKYQYSINTKDIPAGIYFVRVEGNNKTIVKKLVIE